MLEIMGSRNAASSVILSVAMFCMVGSPAVGPANAQQSTNKIDRVEPIDHSPEAIIPDSVLAWDSIIKLYTAKIGEMKANFTFNVTNVSTSTIVIDRVTTSCGCTVAKMPASPWVLQPGAADHLDAVLDLAGKTGTLTKAVTIHSNLGEKSLLIRATIGDAPRRSVGVPIPFMGVREKNQEIARKDRQSIFKGDCAKCHVEPAKNKSGEQLYAAACGICHDAEHRADSVPDLHRLNHETNREFWRTSIAHGKDKSMMPAFAMNEGGSLTTKQIDSLVDYLEANSRNSDRLR